MKCSASLLGLALAACASLACGRGPQPAAGDDTGSIGLALDLAAGVSLAEATYTITGAGGYSRMVTTRVGNAAKLSPLIGGTPTGMGYILTVVGLASDGVSICTGTSAPFDVVAGGTTQVSLRLQCTARERTGNIQIGGMANYCAVIDTLRASAPQAPVGQTIALTSSSHDRNDAPAPIAFAWTATSGTFDDARVGSPTFRCTLPGPATLTLSISDGDCGDSRSLTVTCTGGPAADAGAARPDGGVPPQTTSGDSCLACESTSAHPACATRYGACVNLSGTATDGPAAGTPRNALCIDLLTCVHASRCDSSGNLRDCFCGVGVDDVTCQSLATGACRIVFLSAGESTSHATVLARIADPSFALGAAADLIQECEQKPAPLCAASCGH